MSHLFHSTSLRGAFLSVTVALMLAACSKPAPAPEPIRAVKVITVGVDNFQSGQEFSGEVRARVESRMGFRVSGKIIRRNVELGQHVIDPAQ